MSEGPITALLAPITGHLAEVGLAVAALVLGLRKAQAKWGSVGVDIAQSRTDTAEADARTDIVEQLRNELTRLSEQRLLVGGELAKLQLHILELTKQAGYLTTQVSLLTSENVALKGEITELRAEVSRLRTVHVGASK